LSNTFWADRPRVSGEEGASLTQNFLEEEIKTAIFSMKNASAPGPNGFGAHFLKSFRPTIKDDYMALFKDFHKGDLDIRRMNYGIISLVPKIKEANNIKQYRPICLVNVDYKGITKPKY
jgi:hypothetical protein